MYARVPCSIGRNLQQPHSTQLPYHSLDFVSFLSNKLFYQFSASYCSVNSTGSPSYSRTSEPLLALDFAQLDNLLPPQTLDSISQHNTVIESTRRATQITFIPQSDMQ
jgi:hypothetical protein